MTSLAQLTPRERIVRSLFSEKDESGALLESYITHVKIFEDVQYPSEPPPEPTLPENLKERYILLSVKKNGRVRMHKSRGNDNGTFQIGKTWGLEDLQRIEDSDRRGIVISLLKPYYWTMESVKDKYMFVSALTKVYKKYTGGRMFEMVNFDSQHLPSGERSASIGVQPQLQHRAERSVSAQVPSERTPQQTSPLRTQRSVSEFRDPASHDQQRNGSLSAQSSAIPSYTPISNANGPQSRVASSQYGGPDNRLSNITTTTMSPPIARPQQRSISGVVDERSRRGAVPFASPPLQQSPLMPLNPSVFARPAREESQQNMTRSDNRPARTHHQASLGSPMTFNDNPAELSPVLDKLPEKSLRRQAIDSPTTELASTLRNNGPIPNHAYPMSPPTPAKSPARRPSNVRTMSSGSSRALHERQNATIPAIPSVASSPVPDMPVLPSKSGARPSDPGRTTDRHSVPWQTPVEQPRSDDYFTAIKGQVVNGPAGIAAPTPPTGESVASQILVKDAQDAQFTEKGSEVSNAPSNDEENIYVEDAIKDFKWTARDGVNALASQLQDELTILEAANIHSIVENDSRLADLMAKLDKGIDQCQDMENLLTIYEFELATVADNIKDIEGQSQGLQVQTANQVALVEEISRVLASITISETDLDVLKGRGGNLESADGIANIEKSLINLYRALKSMRDEKSSGSDSSMSAMHSKNQEYVANSSGFLSRLSKYLQIKFQAALLAKEPDSVSRIEPPHVLPGHDDGFMTLAPYAALMLYAREIEPNYHTEYMKSYTAAAKASWQEPIRNFAGQWKAHARRATTEETDMMFTASKEQQSLGATRNATLKRSNTLAKQIRSVTATKSEKENGISRTPASEVFRTILDNFVLLLANEQNFLVSFFHLSSFNSYDYADYVELEVKSRITVASLDDHRPTEPNRQFAKERYLLMEAIFGWTTAELLSLIDYLAGLDAIQTIGILKSLEVVIVEWADSDQEFMLRTLSKFKDRAAALLNRFIEAQVRAIKETKITSKKRKGVVPVFEIFPDVVERIEIQLRTSESNSVSTNQLEIRRIVNDAYEQMSKAMFDSVRTIASSSSVTAQGNADPEDKEVLNYHILMVQNMHQYLEALGSRNNAILEEFRSSAKKQYSEHLRSYTRQIMSRPIGRFIDFVEGYDKCLRQKEDPATKPMFSQNVVKRLLNDHDERDMRKGISGMWKRVDKHFADDDVGGGPGVGSSGGNENNGNVLLGIVWRTVQQDYLAIMDRATSIFQNQYADCKVDWTRQTLLGAFAKREI